MSYNPLELTELEEDITGVNPANLITTEYHSFEDSNMRIFAPDLGQFHVNKNFEILDARTGNKLVRNKDFFLEYFSQRVFNKSGIDNAYLIHVKNPVVMDVHVTYQAVGGLYTSPAYLIALMMDRYPDGIGPVIYWKNILFKPDQFVPAGHKHHALEVYGLSPHVHSLEMVRGGLADKDRVKFEAFYKNTMDNFQILMDRITNNYNSLINNFTEVRKGLEAQQGDFIHTDSQADQTVLRGYGKWKRYLNTVLAAGGPQTAGTTLSVGAGYQNPVRLTNIYQRIDDPWGNGGDLEDKTLILQASANTFNEGGSITIDILGVNVPPGTLITGRYLGLPADNIQGGLLAWQATLDAFGKATITLQTINNYRTTGNIEITIMPDFFATSAIKVLMVDTSKTPTYDLYFSADAAGVNRITRVNEGAVMYMNLVVGNPSPGLEFDFNYSAGTATQDDFTTTLPANVIVPSNGITRMRIEVKNDEIAEGEEVLVACMLPKGSTDLGRAVARSEIVIVDSSFQASFDAYFSEDTTGLKKISEVNEGQTFYLYATTSLPNGTQVLFEYGGTTNDDDFVSRPTSGVVQGGKVIAPIAVKADGRTEDNEIMGMTIKRTNGSILANLSIVIRDTSIAPEAYIWFAGSYGDPNPQAEFNEGDTIFITISTRNVENGTYVDIEYAMDGATNQLEINAEFDAPLPTRVPIDNNLAIIPARIKLDYTADDDRNFSAKLVMNERTATCLIRDTSIPVADTKFSNNAAGNGSITEVNEGQTAYFIVETKGFIAGDILDLAYSGSATDSDFTQPRPAQIVVSSTGFMAIPYAVKNDYTTEGIENMIITVRTGPRVLNTSELIIRDTSLEPIINVLLSLSPTNQVAMTEINEGVTAYVCCNYQFVDPGSVMTWKVNHISTTDADFNKVTGSKQAIAYSGGWNDQITTIADKTTEGAETFTISVSVTLGDGTVRTATTPTIRLNDTSLTELFTLVFSSDSNGLNVISTVDEGGAFYIVAKGTNIPNGTQFTLSLPNSGPGFAGNGDFDPVISNQVITMNNNLAWSRHDVKLDRTDEGDETLNVTATRVSTNVSQTASLVVRDTSRRMKGTLSIRQADGSRPPNNLFNEGQSGFVYLEWTDGTIGDRINTYLMTPGVVNDDFTNHEFGQERTVNAVSGNMRWNFTLANDRITEGTEAFNIEARNLTTNGIFNLDAAYMVLDTSKTTTYTESGWYNYNNQTVVSVNEGESVLLQTVPIDGVIGDVYRMSITGGNATMNEDYSVNTADIIYNQMGMKVQWPFNIIADRKTEGNETLQARITNATTGQVVGTWLITIVDTSKTPSSNAAWYNAASGGSVINSSGEGVTVYFRYPVSNAANGDEWSFTYSGTSTASLADVDWQDFNFVYSGQPVNQMVRPMFILADETSEPDELLIIHVNYKAAGTSNWVLEGMVYLNIIDTSKTPIIDLYYSTNANGTDRIQQTDEGTTAWMIANTQNIAIGTALQVNFAGSTVDNNDFTSPFPIDKNQMQTIVVAANGIANYRFDIKNDMIEG